MATTRHGIRTTKTATMALLGAVLLVAAGCGGGGGEPTAESAVVPTPPASPPTTPPTTPPPTPPSTPPTTPPPTTPPTTPPPTIPPPPPTTPPPTRLAYDRVSALALRGGMLLGADTDSGTLLHLETATQTANPLSEAGVLEIEAMAYDAAADIVYAAESTTQTLIAIDVGGAVEPVGVPGALARSGIRAMAFDSTNGVLYAVDSDTDELLVLDTTDGTAHLVVALSPAAADTIEAMTYDPVSDALVAVDRETRFLVEIDRTTGVVTARGLTAFAEIRAIAILPGTETILVSETHGDRIVKINRLTGATIVD